MTITTANGKEYKCSYVKEYSSPELLFVHIFDVDVKEAEATFKSQEALPLEGFEKFTHFVSFRVGGNGAIIVLDTKRYLT